MQILQNLRVSSNGLSRCKRKAGGFFKTSGKAFCENAGAFGTLWNGENLPAALSCRDHHPECGDRTGAISVRKADNCRIGMWSGGGVDSRGAAIMSHHRKRSKIMAHSIRKTQKAE